MIISRIDYVTILCTFYNAQILHIQVDKVSKLIKTKYIIINLYLFYIVKVHNITNELGT